GDCFWVVPASFVALALADESASWLAVLEPLVTLPPAIETGTLALTAFWSLFAAATAPCFVFASCAPICAAPAPPQPSLQDEPPTFCVWSCVCFVFASFDAFASADESAFCVALL